MKLRITTLSENTATLHSVLAEWGLSIVVETDDVNVLLDTGPGISACYNAGILGIDLSEVDKIVLSHSHSDHTGGLWEILRKIRKEEIEIIAHPYVWSLRYVRRPGRADSFSGIPFQRSQLESLGARFNLTTKPVKISNNIMTTGEIPMVTDFEEVVAPGDSVRLIQDDTGFRPDEILDDQGIVINTEHGLVVITGCAHRGIINAIYHAQQIIGEETVYAVIGGSHLVGVSQERIQRTIDVLRELDVQKIGLCHCTSMPGIAKLAHELGDKFFFNNAGTQIDLP